MNEYIPVFVLGAVAVAFALVSVLIASVVGPKRYNRAKMDAYECGIEPTAQPMGAGRYPVKFYLTAMLFIIFDVETIFLFPWAVVLRQMGGYAFVAMLPFMFLLVASLVYEWKRGALEWD